MDNSDVDSDEFVRESTVDESTSILIDYHGNKDGLIDDDDKFVTRIPTQRAAARFWWLICFGVVALSVAMYILSASAPASGEHTLVSPASLSTPTTTKKPSPTAAKSIVSAPKNAHTPTAQGKDHKSTAAALTAIPTATPIQTTTAAPSKNPTSMPTGAPSMNLYRVKNVELTRESLVVSIESIECPGWCLFRADLVGQAIRTAAYSNSTGEGEWEIHMRVPDKGEYHLEVTLEMNGSHDLSYLLSLTEAIAKYETNLYWEDSIISGGRNIAVIQQTQSPPPTKVCDFTTDLEGRWIGPLQPKSYNNSEYLNDDGHLQYFPFDCNLRSVEEYNMKLVPGWIDQVGASNPGVPVYILVNGDSLHRHMYFQIADALSCNLDTSAGLNQKKKTIRYTHAECYGHTAKGTGFVLIYHFLAHLKNKARGTWLLELDMAYNDPISKFRQSIEAIDEYQGAIPDASWLKLTPRFVLTYPGHHDHDLSSENFKSVVENHLKSIIQSASEGTVERIGLSGICATNAAISQGHWKVQNNIRITDKNRIFRAAVENAVVPADVELTRVVNWYQPALAAQRVTLSRDSVHFGNELIYTQWLLEVLHLTLFGEQGSGALLPSSQP